MILFIHGFASCGLGQKSRILIDRFGRQQVLTPDLAFAPLDAIAQLEQLLRQHPVELLVGSSLGGYYATWLNWQWPLPTVLINPAVRPWQLLADHLGPQQRWCDGKAFEFTTRHAAQLRSLHRETLQPQERYLVLLQSGDEVLDYRAATHYYRDHRVIVESGGNHRFENLADYLPVIDNFRQNSTLQP
jgi:predicted esterase YcpF (UPF0227 family)